MTTDYKILAQTELGELALDNSTVKEQLVYEVPSNTQFTNSSTSIVNTGNSAGTYSISVVSNEEKSTAVTNLSYQVLLPTTKFVAVGFGPNVAYSTNGINWTQANVFTSQYYNSVAYGNGKFVAVSGSYANNVAAYSTDGVTWTESTLPSSQYWIEVTYGNGKFVAVPTSSTNVIAYSNDGITWAQTSLPLSASWLSVSYGNEKFFVVNQNQSNVIVYSNDGITWAQTSLPLSRNWTSVAYGNGKFVTFAKASTNAAYSNDGITWTQTTVPFGGAWLVTYGNGKFVAVEDYNGIVVYSTDGITWTASNTATRQPWKSITYGNGKFVVISSEIVDQSTDGITWTESSMPISDYWYSVTYGEPLTLTETQTEVLQSLNKHQVIYNKEILAGETHIISGGVTLNSGDQIRAKSTSSDIIVNVYGAELS